MGTVVAGKGYIVGKDAVLPSVARDMPFTTRDFNYPPPK
jgi:hypothetical protein